MHAIRARASLAALVLFVCSSALGGGLTPPGPPAPTMKTLNEVEARIPIGPLTTPGDATTVYRITAPGSYYLTGDIVGQAGKHGVSISVGQVTLDLNGFSLRGVAGAQHGVSMDVYYEAVTVRNGVVAGWPRTGVLLRGDGGVVSDLRVFNCGEWGISAEASFGATVERCSVYSVGFTANIAGGGIRMTNSGIVRACLVRSVSGVGISVFEGAAFDCVVDVVYADPGAGQPGFGIEADQVDRCMTRITSSSGVVAAKVARGCSVRLATGAPYVGPNIVESY